MSLAKGIKLKYRSNDTDITNFRQTASEPLDILEKVKEKITDNINTNEELIMVYYEYNPNSPAFYLSIPMDPIANTAHNPLNIGDLTITAGSGTNKTFKHLAKKQQITKQDDNFYFFVKKSDFATIASNIINGGPIQPNDILKYDDEYLEKLKKKPSDLLKTATAIGWGGDAVWSMASWVLLAFAEHIKWMPLASSIAFPFILGPLVGYINYRAQIADYEAENHVSPPPEVLEKFKLDSYQLSFKFSCAVGGWTLAYELAVPAFELLVGTTLSSIPAYWVMVVAVGVLAAIGVIVGGITAECFANWSKGEGWRRNTLKEGQTNYLWLGFCAFFAGALFPICSSIPDFFGLTEWFAELVGGQAGGKLLSGAVSSVCIGAGVTGAFSLYNHKESTKSLINKECTIFSAIKGFFGGNQQLDEGQRVKDVTFIPMKALK